jgi:mRNA interferase MazF
VLVLKDNLPFDDFIGISLSSQIEQLQKDEYLLDNSAFADGGIPLPSKLILRKTFVIAKSVVMKRYGTLSETAFAQYHASFCQYFCCGKV